MKNLAHPLISLAIRKTSIDGVVPKGAVYSALEGYWKTSSGPLVEVAGDLVSKKADVETGEDAKGE